MMKHTVREGGGLSRLVIKRYNTHSTPAAAQARPIIVVSPASITI